MINVNKKNNRFTALVSILVVFILIIIGVAGYFIIRQLDKTSGIYSYGGYNFPYMPSGFILTTKSTSSGYVTVNYTTTGTLEAIEAEIINICKKDNYYFNNDFGTISSSKNGEITYSAQAATCINKTGSNTWQFNISARANPNKYDVSIWSEPRPVPM
jgi:hypothetical protein